MTTVAPTQFFRIEEWDSTHALAKPYPREWAEARWRPLAEALDKLRAAIKHPLRVTPNGGYRCPEHNAAIGGARASQHMEGRAADIVSDQATAAEVHALVLKLWWAGELPLLSGLGSYPGFTHVDVGGPHPVGSIRRWSGGRAAT